MTMSRIMLTPVPPKTVGDAVDQMEAAWEKVQIGMSRREVFDAGWIAGFDFSARSAPPVGADEQ